jgi:hypothetical protein
MRRPAGRAELVAENALLRQPLIVLKGDEQKHPIPPPSKLICTWM